MKAMKREKWLKFCLICPLFIIASILLLGATTIYVSAQTTPTYPKILRFTTLSPGTSFYAIASGVAKVASDHTTMTLITVPTTGVSSWLPMLNELGTADLAIWELGGTGQLWTGKVTPEEPPPKGFPSKLPYGLAKNIRILMSGNPHWQGLLVRKDSGMRETSDLRGKKVAWYGVSQPGTMCVVLASVYNGGMTMDDINMVPVNEPIGGVKAVQEKRVDAAPCSVGMAAISEADVLVGVRLLNNSMDPERVKVGKRVYPGASFRVLKAGPAGIPEDTFLIAGAAVILASNRMADHVAYKLVETWWAHYKEWAPFHAQLTEWTRDLFVNEDAPTPYHNGAIQFYKEKGVWSPKMQEKQNQFLKGD